MNRQAQVEQARVLRGITSRLNNSNSKLPLQLVETARRSISDLTHCKTILASAEDQLKIAGTDTSVVVHSFKTKLSSLLQDKNPSARLAAIILIKATVHIGGYEVLSKNGASWARALLSNLTRPGPASTKRLVIIVLIQIYRATQSLPNLAREVTTPTLKDFIPACIGLVSTKKAEGRPATTELRAPLLADVLQAFVKLLPHHPNVFRPFTKSLSELCGRVISASSSKDAAAATAVRSDVRALAQQLLALISRCAAKSGSGDDWGRNIRLLKEHVVHTADEVFRSVVETINPDAISIRPQTTTKKTRNQQPSGELIDDLHLSAWTGLESGIERLVALLQTLQAFLAVQGPSTATYILPVDTVLNIIERLMNVFPGQHPEDLASITANTETTREERELLFLRSSHIQIEALNLLKVLCQRLGSTAVSIANGALEYLIWCFKSGISNARLRSAYYGATTSMLRICGSSLTTNLVETLEPIIRSAAGDIISKPNPDRNSSSSSSSNPPAGPSAPTGTAGKNSADAYLTIRTTQPVTLTPGPAHIPAKQLLKTVLTHVPAESIPNALRNLIDQTVVLMRDEEAMLASVLNMAAHKPGTAANASIVPFLAREHAESVVTEAFLRPRMPGMGRKHVERMDEEEMGEEEMGEEWGQAPATAEVVKETAEARRVRESSMEPLQKMWCYGAEMKKAEEMDVDGEEGEAEAGAVEEKVLKSTRKISPFAVTAAVAVPESRGKPQEPKRVRDEERDLADPKRVKLATFEPASGPTAVSVIEEPKEPTGAGKDEDDGESDSDGSLPSIHMGEMSDDEEDEDEDEQ